MTTRYEISLEDNQAIGKIGRTDRLRVKGQPRRSDLGGVRRDEADKAESSQQFLNGAPLSEYESRLVI